MVLFILFEFEVKPRASVWEKRLGISLSDKTQKNSVQDSTKVDVDSLEAFVLPSQGVELPITWGDLGAKMVRDGVIDEQKFKEIAGQMSPDDEQIFNGNWNKPIVMTDENNRFLLNMLWAFGLANDNKILTHGEMTDPKYGGDAGKFASTGGWSLSRGDVMNHFSAHNYVMLDNTQQEMVDRVSSGIFRPCCGNSTHFPDCNHGMAMLGLLELMASSGVSEEKMYEVALRVNSYWFPQTYLDLATYFKEQGQEWSEVDPKIALSANYSSGQGYQATRQKIKSLPEPPQGGGSCGV